MKNNITINKEWGFYGTIKNQFEVPRDAIAAWNLMVCQLGNLYPNKTNEEIIEFLNSTVGRHLADYLADRMNGGGIGKLSDIIIRLNLLTMGKWWDSFNGKDSRQPKPSMLLLYRNALAHIMKNKTIKQEIDIMLGINKTSLWPNADAWLKCDYTTAEEIKYMWMHLQSKFPKEIANYKN